MWRAPGRSPRAPHGCIAAPCRRWVRNRKGTSCPRSRTTPWSPTHRRCPSKERTGLPPSTPGARAIPAPPPGPALWYPSIPGRRHARASLSEICPVYAAGFQAWLIARAHGPASEAPARRTRFATVFFCSFHANCRVITSYCFSRGTATTVRSFSMSTCRARPARSVARRTRLPRSRIFRSLRGITSTTLMNPR